MEKLFIVLLAVVALSFAAAPKPKDKYVRPCQLRDLKCIRDNLSANSQCRTEVQGSIPSQYTIKRFAFDTPFFNASYIDNDLVVQNQDKCFVSEFFFNVEADSAVLAIDCPGLIFSSNRTLIQHSSLKEDKIYSFNSTWKYPLLRMTTNIQRADSLDLCSSFVFTDVTALPKFILTPNDAPTKSFLSSDLSFLNIYERENCYWKGPYIMKYFVNSLICDFGCY